MNDAGQNTIQMIRIQEWVCIAHITGEEDIRQPDMISPMQKVFAWAVICISTGTPENTWLGLKVGWARRKPTH